MLGCQVTQRTRVRHASNTCGDEGQPTRADCGVGCSATRLPSAHRGGHGQFVAEVDAWVNWWQTCPWLHQVASGSRVWLGRLALRTRVRHASNTCGMRASRPGQTLESDARLPGYPPHARAPRQQHMRDEGQPTWADAGVGCSAARLPSARACATPATHAA